MKFLLSLLLAASSIAQTIEYGPAPIGFNFKYHGAPGNSPFYYWIIANFPNGKSAITGPLTVLTTGTLDNSTNVGLSWSAVAGATSYDILRKTVSVTPVGACNCAVSIRRTGTGFTDNANSTLAYTVSTGITIMGGGATIPNTTDLIAGDGAGNGADSGIPPGTVVKGAANLVTVNSVPYVSGGATLNQDGGSFTYDPVTHILNIVGGISAGSSPPCSTVTTSVLCLKEAAAPTGEANVGQVYTKSDHLWHTKLNNGSEDTFCQVTLANCSSGGTPGGSNTQVQYNNSGAFGGITGATTNGTALTLVAPVLGTPASVNLSNATSLPCAAMPALTGDTTSSAGACATTTVKVNGISYSATAAAHSVEVITTANTTATAKVVPDCTDTGGNHLNFTQSSDAFSCGTSSSGGGSGVLEQHTASGSASLNFTTCITGTNNNYKIVFENLVATNNGLGFLIRAHTVSGYDSGSNYTGVAQRQSTAGSAASQNIGGTSWDITGKGTASNSSVTGGFDGQVNIFHVNSSTQYKGMTGYMHIWDNSGSPDAWVVEAGTYKNTVVVDGFQVLSSDGTNIASGTVYCSAL